MSCLYWEDYNRILYECKHLIVYPRMWAKGRARFYLFAWIYSFLLLISISSGIAWVCPDLDEHLGPNLKTTTATIIITANTTITNITVTTLSIWVMTSSWNNKNYSGKHRWNKHTTVENHEMWTFFTQQLRKYFCALRTKIAWIFFARGSSL